MRDGIRPIDRYDLYSREMTILRGLCENIAAATLAQRRFFETNQRNKADQETLEREQSWNAIARVDENALITASWKSLRFLDLAIKEGIIPAEFADQFNNIRKHLKDVRDMREHDDEYRLGKGRFKARHAHRDEESGAVVTAEWTLIVRDRYLIGGRLPLVDLSRAVRQLFQRLQEGGFWPLPWTDLGLVEHGPLTGE